MPKNEHLAILKQGIDAWNTWRKEHPEIKPDLSEATLSRVDMRNANFSHTNFEAANLRRTNISGSDLTSASLRKADLTRTIFKGSNLKNVDLTDAIALGTDFSHCDLSGANLTGVDLAGAGYIGDSEHVAKLKKGVKSWNEWRENNPEINPDLREINLAGLDLTGLNLSNANLRGADLSGATLNNTNMMGANLENSDLVKVSIQGCDFRRANLSNADLTFSYIYLSRFSDTLLVNANLFQSVIKFTECMGSDFSGAVFGETIISNSFLSKVTGLDKCHHIQSSTIDYLTVANSSEIPVEFLRGTGLPNEVINAFISLIGDESKYFSCFISYSNKDHDFASKLYKKLQDAGIRCWFAPEDMQGGKKLIHQIGQAIDTHDKFLLILSKNSMSSNWVLNEIKATRKKEDRTGRQMFFPISIASFEELSNWELVDPLSGENLAEEVLSYFIPNFSESNEDIFNESFSKLVKSLKENTV